MRYETTIGLAGAAGANETVNTEIAPGTTLSEVTGLMRPILATYTREELQRIESVCDARGIEIGEFNYVTRDGADLIKVELDIIAVTPPGEKVASKSAVDRVQQLLWEYAR